MDLKILKTPTVYLVGKQIVQSAELERFLADHGVNWSTDSTVPAEILTETAGRVCFDDATEILTDDGWKLFANLNRNESVLTLNPETNRAEFQKPAAYQDFEFEGELICADGRDVSLAVTPDHRMYGTFDYFQKEKVFEFVAARDIGPKRFCIPSAAKGWAGTYPESVEIAETAYSQSLSNQTGQDFGTRTTVLSSISIRGKSKLFSLAQLLAYYATEGSVRDYKSSGTGIVIYGNHVDEVALACNTLRLPWKVWYDKRNNVPRVIVGGGLRWMNFFVENGGRGSFHKRLPKWVLNLPAYALQQIWSILVRTDGHVYASGREVLVTSSPTLAGQAQEILAKLGASSSCRPMPGGTNLQMYMVSRKAGRLIHLNDKQSLTKRRYAGRVYCVSTTNGIVYVRRDGKVHFSGNCYMSFAKPRPGGNSTYLNHIKEVGHGSVLEHGVWSLLLTGISRSLTHELVRHRAGFGYSQLSQRYVDESIAEYVEPDIIANDPELHAIWKSAVEKCHAAYMELTSKLNEKLGDRETAAAAMLTVDADRTSKRKAARQAARSVLPNATETKIFVTGNARALRHFLEQRGSRYAEPEIRKLADAVLEVLVADSPNLFGDYERIPLPDGTFEIVTKFAKV